MTVQSVALFAALAFFVSCNTPPAGGDPGPADPEATPLAKNLLKNLHDLSAQGIMLGHQDALAYGMGWKGEEFRTDINDVIGDHPAVFGWDLGHMGDEANIDGVPFSEMKRLATAAFERGGINTYSWHMRNYAIGGSSWDTDSCVEACLPGGAVHELYLRRLDQAAAFFSELRTASGELIPVTFRPFHEMGGSWFWWGEGNCSPEQYKELFRFTIDYLRKEKGQHQLLIVYSPDKFSSAEEYLRYYPGDDYVDILAFDDYGGMKDRVSMQGPVRSLKILDSLGTVHNKLTAFSETGQETIPDSLWYSRVVLPVLETNPGISWILFWRNGRPDHFYAPFPGHPAVPDFRAFMDNELMLSLSELPDMYK